MTSPAADERLGSLAFVLLAETHFPQADDIVSAFAEFAADGERLTVSATDTTSAAPVLELAFSDGGTVFIAAMPVPVPDGEADAGAPFSMSAVGTGWTLPVHEAHLVVMLRQATPGSAVEVISRFTSLIAAVAKASRAVGIYWGGAGATHDAEFFVATARSRTTAHRIMLWTGVSIADEGDGRISLLSTGMKQLGLPDLLLVAPRPDGAAALETFFDLLAYLVDLGQPIPEGDTVGRTSDERLPVQYVPSPVDAGTRVWSVELN